MIPMVYVTAIAQRKRFVILHNPSISSGIYVVESVNKDNKRSQRQVQEIWSKVFDNVSDAVSYLQRLYGDIKVEGEHNE